MLIDGFKDILDPVSGSGLLFRVFFLESNRIPEKIMERTRCMLAVRLCCNFNPFPWIGCEFAVEDLRTLG